ncbi:hypothetical protein PBRA_000219 [Plasmodiophora brassicae]|uniref:Uncharacterized protein n=1 Tax=Plasmodiophora brassicae TaxID=37360 RepID=A0A0G4IGX5_PLABS|nr:hypothetical protein PBRA_000219 [Plasmodiophora brassicae]
MGAALRLPLLFPSDDLNQYRYAEQKARASDDRAPTLVSLARHSTLPPLLPGPQRLLASPMGRSPTSPLRSTTGAITARPTPPASPIADLVGDGTVHDAMRSGFSKQPRMQISPSGRERLRNSAAIASNDPAREFTT